MDSRAGPKNISDRSYVALPPASTSTTTEWSGQPEVEALWMLSGAYLLFFGQAGFALLEAGHVRASVTRQVAIKVLLQACTVAVCWWVLGYPFAFGEGGPLSNAFIGGQDWFLTDSSSKPDPNQHPELYPLWMLHMVYCCTAVAAASCAIAERGRLIGHIIVAVLISCWIYPVVVHWVWSTEGWLSGRRSYGGSLLGANGFIDTAGSCVVHVTAGTVGLAGAWLIGPRQGRQGYSSDGCSAVPTGSSLLLSGLGGLLLWLSWYGMAPSNVVLMVSSLLVAARVSVAVTLAAASGCLSVFCFQLLRSPQLNLRAALDGALAGLVAISASCAVVEMYGAFIIGLVGGAAYLTGLQLMAVLQVDDPVHIAAIHLLPGLWGAVAPGLFATPGLLPSAGYGGPAGSSGIFYGGDGKQLGIQLLGSVVVMMWALAMSSLLFLGLGYFKLLRVPAEKESLGWCADESDAGNDSDSNSGESFVLKQARAASQCARSASLAIQQQYLVQRSTTAANMRLGPQFVADGDILVGVPSPGGLDWSYRASRCSSMAGSVAAHHTPQQPGIQLVAGSANSQTSVSHGSMAPYMGPSVGSMTALDTRMAQQLPEVWQLWSSGMRAAAAAAAATDTHAPSHSWDYGGQGHGCQDEVSRRVGSSCTSQADLSLVALAAIGGSHPPARAQSGTLGLRKQVVHFNTVGSSSPAGQLNAAELGGVAVGCTASSPDLAVRAGSTLQLATRGQSCSGVGPAGSMREALKEQQLGRAFSAGPGLSTSTEEAVAAGNQYGVPAGWASKSHMSDAVSADRSSGSRLCMSSMPAQLHMAQQHPSNSSFTSLGSSSLAAESSLPIKSIAAIAPPSGFRVSGGTTTEGPHLPCNMQQMQQQPQPAGCPQYGTGCGQPSTNMPTNSAATDAGTGCQPVTSQAPHQQGLPGS